jgi:pilus assembly protein CpaE
MRVVVTTETAGSGEALRQAALGAGLECAAGDCVSFDELTVRLARSPADLVLVGVGPDAAAALDTVQHVTAHHGLPAWAVGPMADQQQVLRFLRGGAREYLDQGKARDELTLALERLQSVNPDATRPGQTVAVIGAAPGSGVTTVATGLAFALARKHADQVVLAELGGGVPELALDLDLEPEHSVAELLRDWERMDHAMVRQALVAHPAGVQVLAYPPGALAVDPAAPGAVRQAVLLLRTAFPFTVLDLDRAAGAAELEGLALADAVVVVVRLDVPGLRLSRQLLRHLADQGIPEGKVVVVANRYGERGQLAWRQAEQALGRQMQVWLPDDPGRLNHAHNHGRPLIETARGARLTRRIEGLARQLNGQRK